VLANTDKDDSFYVRRFIFSRFNSGCGQTFTDVTCIVCVNKIHVKYSLYVVVFFASSRIVGVKSTLKVVVIRRSLLQNS
jgi:hypothetical protein